MTTQFTCDDTDSLVAYVYDETDADLGAAIASHLATCAACHAEVSALGGVRRALGQWAPPAPLLRFSLIADGQPAASAPPPSSRWQAVPHWAQLMAATLALAVSAAVANVQVHRDASGWTVTTGWLASGQSSATAAVPDPASEWRPAVAALEQSLRSELNARASGEPAPVASNSASLDEAAIARVRALIRESEKRQQQELALRLTQFGRDFDMQRRADLLTINQGLGQLEGRTGAEVARQREMLNYIVRTGMRPPQ